MRLWGLALLPVLVWAQPAEHPKVPRAWDDAAVRNLEVPLANPAYSPVHMSEAEYYRLPERVIWKSYPIYHPDREPAGYQEWLKQQEPRTAFDPQTLQTEQDWIRAGEVVFQAASSFGPVFFSAEDVRDRAFYEETGMPVAADGTIPFARWVIREKGKVELGSMGCNTCHVRVLENGTVVAGAQGNNPGDRQGARMLRRAAAFAPDKILERVRGFAKQFEMPWLADDPNRAARTMSLEELIAAGEAIPAGVTARSNTSLLYPPQIPDLIGVRERQYLDHTGLVRHRTIGDLMRYSALVQDVLPHSRFGDLAPQAAMGKGSRFSDAQLYALAQYLYALQPPDNPNPVNAVARRGETIFKREGCTRCHTPPLYTNNKLIAVDGFTPPADHRKRFDLLDRRLGTDPHYALASRKGTGYYKVPSLKGLWYRGPLEHNGSVATLEEWLDPARLRVDYAPGGYKGPAGERRGVKGHEFGLTLSPEEKAALIYFLKTL